MKEATYTISLSGGGETLPFKGKKKYSMTDCISLLAIIVRDIIDWRKDIVITIKLSKGEKEDCISTGLLFWEKINEIATGILAKAQEIELLNYILGFVSIHVNDLIIIRNGKQLIYPNKNTLGMIMR